MMGPDISWSTDGAVIFWAVVKIETKIFLTFYICPNKKKLEHFTHSIASTQVWQNNCSHFQEFHIAYVIIKMANSPRPGVWALEKSSNFGETWQPWQYFADTPVDCKRFFDADMLDQPTRDDQVICTTAFSRIVPLVDGEVNG